MPTRERQLKEKAAAWAREQAVQGFTREALLEMQARLERQERAEAQPEVLTVRPAVMDAVLELQQALREDERLYHDCVLFLRRLQRTEHGPLTDALEVFVGGA